MKSKSSTTSDEDDLITPPLDGQLSIFMSKDINLGISYA